MNTATDQLRAIFAHVAPERAPELSARDRRRDGQIFPTVPAGGLDLTPTEMATALFEVSADDLFDSGTPGTDTLYAALLGAVHALGPGGLAEAVTVFAGLDAGEFWEVGACRSFAYRLALSFWYEGARARPMTTPEAAAALYLSDAHRHHTASHPVLLSRAVRQGAARVPTRVLIHLGRDLGADHTGPAGMEPHGWLYRQALPDHHRRKACLDQVRKHTTQPLPLVVRLDDGTFTLGTTPPPDLNGRCPRPARALW
ncbi:hypothetical protein [Streptomyces sp. NPDC060366]|uniref:hypothetical protein n=1 Tax=Streptomyces sp. NPDC060366 TaxID=3347105 RepID=UPI00364DE72D